MFITFEFARLAVHSGGRGRGVPPAVKTKIKMSWESRISLPYMEASREGGGG